MYNSLYIKQLSCIIISLSLFPGCKKLLDLDPPKSTITMEQVFSNNSHAERVLNAVYMKMTHSEATSDIAGRSFSAGLSTIMGSLSADEMYNVNGPSSQDYYNVSTNKISLRVDGRTQNLWNSAYKTIYDANTVIVGIAGSRNGDLLDSLKTQWTAEALTLRAFTYFYLINFFGDVPLVQSIDYNETIAMERTPVAQVYEQIIKDLKAAKAVLLEDFSAGKGERVRVNKWFAEALLARIYLYTGQYTEAIVSASAVLNRTDLFKLEDKLEDVFKKSSWEAIFQLKPNNANTATRNATPEGFGLNPANATASAPFGLYPDFINSFEPADKRKTEWMISRSDIIGPYKYKQGSINSAVGGTVSEYYTMMRLAELYLIRAEAKLLLSDGNKDEAIDDLNALRPRTGLPNFPKTLSADQVKESIANERKYELFAEWGHRWFDLKRTGKAEDVLSILEVKKPWAGNYQLLYPIPLVEIQNNKNIIPNPGYEL